MIRLWWVVRIFMLVTTRSLATEFLAC